MFIEDSSNETIAKQISSIIERYNLLVAEIQSIEELQKKKDNDIMQLKTFTDYELRSLGSRINDIKLKIDTLSKIRNFVGKDFKKIARTDSFNRLTRRIDNLNFENRMSRGEFHRVLDR
jgi:hypothetical protein